MIDFHNMDCMQGMKDFPDKYFNLAIVDPVYGCVPQGGYMKNTINGGVARHQQYNLALWQQAKTGKEYFKELFRVSKNQIIWGGNYFSKEIDRNSVCWIVWDKKKPEGITFADAELAWTSFDTKVRIFRYAWNGMIQENMKEKEEKIHPTQKPVALYTWLLQHYAKPGDKILDTHVGSGSSLIACQRLNYSVTGYEIDDDYYRAAVERIERETAQITLFNMGGQEDVLQSEGGQKVDEGSV